MKKNFFVSTPIYYVNGDPHVGSAYTTIAVSYTHLDVYKRQGLRIEIPANDIIYSPHF